MSRVPWGVADVVKTDLWNTGTSDDPFEGLGDGVGVDRVPVDARCPSGADI
jgi:hypothetical protein